MRILQLSVFKWKKTYAKVRRLWFSNVFKIILPPINSPIHKAAGSLVTGRSLQNGKMSMGNRRTERPPDPVLYGGRPSRGFVNNAVRHLNIKQLSKSTKYEFLSWVLCQK